MDTKDIQKQIDEINQKLDLVLEHITEQKQKHQVVEDLVSDLSIISRDAYKSAVEELDEKGVELDVEELKNLFTKLIKNVNNFTQALSTFESLVDLAKDVAPITKEIGIDFINKLHEFEKKGYFEYFSELMKVLGKITKHYTVDDLKRMSTNIEPIVNIARNITHPEFLKTIEKVTHVFADMKINDEVDNKSLYKLYKEFKSPEVRKALSYFLRIVKTMTHENNN